MGLLFPVPFSLSSASMLVSGLGGTCSHLSGQNSPARGPQNSGKRLIAITGEVAIVLLGMTIDEMISPEFVRIGLESGRMSSFNA